MNTIQDSKIITKDNCIASREYTIGKSGQILTLLLGKPFIHDDGLSYVGRYRFICEDFDESYGIAAMDSMQALLFSITMAEEFILNKKLDVEFAGEKGIF